MSDEILSQLTNVRTRYKENLKTKYKDYIKEHIDNVHKAWRIFRALPDVILSDVDDYWLQLSSLIEVHDSSKLTDAEFNGYRRWFFPVDETEKDHDCFLHAWNHHQKNNPHHWEYWVLQTQRPYTILDMPLPYIIEMMMDWVAMSYKFNNKPSEWFFKNEDKILISEKTKSHVCIWLDCLDETYSIMKQGQ